MMNKDMENESVNFPLNLLKTEENKTRKTKQKTCFQYTSSADLSSLFEAFNMPVRKQEMLESYNI